MSNLIRTALENRIPDYVNQDLGRLGTWSFEFALKHDHGLAQAVKSFRNQKAALKNRLEIDPSPAVLARIQNIIRAQSRPAIQSVGFPWRAWVAGMALIGLALLVSWQALPPGIQLNWTIYGVDISTHYEIYRAPVEKNASTDALEFVYVDTIETLDGVAAYEYFDASLLPGQSYVYEVRSIGVTGNTLSSTPLQVDATQALIGQLTLVLTLAVGAFGFYLLTKIDPFPSFGRLYN